MSRLILKAQEAFAQNLNYLEDEFHGDYGELINDVANYVARSYDEYMEIRDYFNKYFQMY